MTRLLLIRHGETTLSAENIFAGDEGDPLSDEGREQVRCLAERLAGEKIAAIYASPFGRTKETAAILAAPHRLEPRLRDGLREISHGRWIGLGRAEVERRFGGEYAAWEVDPYTFAPEGGESGLAVLARALPVVREIVVAHEGEDVVVVSHKATIRLLLASVLGVDPRGYRDRFDQSPAALNIVDFDGPVRARLMLYNDTSHYRTASRRPHPCLSKWWDAPA